MLSRGLSPFALALALTSAAAAPAWAESPTLRASTTPSAPGATVAGASKTAESAAPGEVAPGEDAAAERSTEGPESTSTGVSFGSSVTFDLSHVRAQDGGGLLIGRALVDVNTTLELGRLVGLKNVTVFLQYYGKFGGNASEVAGDYQGFSNIDAATFNGLGEAWVEVRLQDTGGRVKAGRIDANTEFAGLHASEEFVNSSMGYSPTILGMPTYPAPGRGAMAAFERGAVSLRAGTFERFGANENGRLHRTGWLWLGQAQAEWVAAGQREGSLAVGVWHHTGAIETLDGSSREGATGPYFTFQQTLWREHDRKVGDEASRHVHVFAQYGIADTLVSDITKHVGAGVAVRAPFASRRNDMVGVGLSRAWRSAASAEHAGGVELAAGPFYLWQITDHVSVKPDIQVLRQHCPEHGTRVALLSTWRVVVEY